LIAELRAAGIGIRVGIHTGRCQLYGDDVVGLAVNIAARIMSLAGRGEVLVSPSIRDDMPGDGHEFEPRGMHVLKGVPGDWLLYAAV
jgi:class 3 adenylate cyclase